MESASPYDEQLLLKQIASGDESAFRQLFDQYKGRFYAAAFKMLHSEAEAEEIVQEVFVAIWTKRRHLATVENARSYLFTIVYRSVYAHFKKLALEKRLKAHAFGAAHKHANNVDDAVSVKESLRLLDKAMEQLPPQQKEVYRLSQLEGLSRNEIAEQLNISPNTVKNHLIQANKTVRAYLVRFTSVILAGVVSHI